MPKKVKSQLCVNHTSFFQKLSFRNNNLSSPILFCTIVLLCSTISFSQDTLTGSNLPPAGIDRHQMPVFLSFGVDDNRFDDGMIWMRDTLFKGKLNPEGLGNKGTYDGTPVGASFYFIGGAEKFDTWRSLYDEGYELGGHTMTHDTNLSELPLTSIYNHIYPVNKLAINRMGIPPSHFIGFRTPFLGFCFAAMEVLKRVGYSYDCSMEGCAIGGSYLELNSYYPGVMNGNGTAFQGFKVPGFWELPHCVMATTAPTKSASWTWGDQWGTEPLIDDSLWTASSVKGFDSGFWPSGVPGKPNTNAADMYKYLCWTLDAARRGNRAPVDVGLHSDYYSKENTSTSNFVAPLEERKQVLIDFLEYALSFPNVRVVSKVDVLSWMRNPVALDDLSKNSQFDTIITDASENLITANSITLVPDARGSVGSIKSGEGLVWDWTLGQPTDSLFNAPDTRVDVVIPFIHPATGIRTLKITYKSSAPLRISFTQTGLSDDGSSFFTEVASSPDKQTTKTIVLNHRSVFQSFDAKTDGVFNPEEVKELRISPIIIDSSVSGESQITELVLYGAGELTQGTSIVQNIKKVKAATVGVHRNKITVSSISQGSVRINCIDLRGRVVMKETKMPHNGTTTFDLSNLTNGAYIVHLKGIGFNEQRSILINK